MQVAVLGRGSSLQPFQEGACGSLVAFVLDNFLDSVEVRGSSNDARCFFPPDVAVHRRAFSRLLLLPVLLRPFHVGAREGVHSVSLSTVEGRSLGRDYSTNAALPQVAAPFTCASVTASSVAVGATLASQADSVLLAGNLQGSLGEDLN